MHAMPAVRQGLLLSVEEACSPSSVPEASSTASRLGATFAIDRLPGEPGAAIELADVLMMGDGSDVTIGAPNIAGARVMGTIAEQGRAKKIIVFRYKSKTRSRKKTGHRQHFTMIHVDDILAPGESPKPKAQPAAASEEAPKRRGRGRAKRRSNDRHGRTGSRRERAVCRCHHLA